MERSVHLGDGALDLQALPVDRAGGKMFRAGHRRGGGGRVGIAPTELPDVVGRHREAGVALQGGLHQAVGGGSIIAVVGAESLLIERVRDR